MIINYENNLVFILQSFLELLYVPYNFSLALNEEKNHFLI